MARVTAFVLVLCCWITSLRAALSPEEVLQKVEAFYAGVSSLSGRFTQEVYWRKGLTVEVSEGNFWLKKPYLLRWEYRSPERLLIVSNGKQVFFYVEADRQVTVISLQQAFSRPVLRLLSGTGGLRQDFRLLSGTPQGPEDYFLELRPLREDQIARIRIRVKLPRGEVQEIWFWDPLGNLTHLVIENLRVNPPINSRLFAFTPPPGVEILDQTKEDS